MLAVGTGAESLTAIAGRQRWVHGRRAKAIRYEMGEKDLQEMDNRSKCEGIAGGFCCRRRRVII